MTESKTVKYFCEACKPNIKKLILAKELFAEAEAMVQDLKIGDVETELTEAQERIKTLEKEDNDKLDTILAMCFVVAEKDMSVDELESDMNKMSSKPSGYVRAKLDIKNKRITELEAQVERMKCCGNCFRDKYGRCAHPKNNPFNANIFFSGCDNWQPKGADK